LIEDYIVKATIIPHTYFGIIRSFDYNIESGVEE